jgi:hypothetical protein
LGLRLAVVLPEAPGGNVALGTRFVQAPAGVLRQLITEQAQAPYPRTGVIEKIRRMVHGRS